MLYGGFFIGLAASCITSLTFDINGKAERYIAYSIWIGVATAALYGGHRVIGFGRVAEHDDSDRFTVIRQYKSHIWFYFILTVILTFLVFMTFGSWSLVWWLLPGGIIGVGYILPILPGKKRLRDLGWAKIIMVGFSWAWLTAFIPMWKIADGQLLISVIHTIERFCFIVAITIPFEIRDQKVDHAVGIKTIALRFSKRGLTIWMILLCVLMWLGGTLTAIQHYNIPYAWMNAAMCVIVFLVFRGSFRQQSDYYFGGLTDGLMILALLLFSVIHIFL